MLWHHTSIIGEFGFVPLYEYCIYDCFFTLKNTYFRAKYGYSGAWHYQQRLQHLLYAVYEAQMGCTSYTMQSVTDFTCCVVAVVTFWCKIEMSDFGLKRTSNY